MKKILSFSFAFIFALGLFVNTTSATSQIVVSQFDSNGWTFRDISNKYEFIEDDTAPIGQGSLDILTENESDLVQLWHYFAEAIPLGDFNGSYDSIRLGGVAHAQPSYWMSVSLNDGSNGYIWPAYEPVYNIKPADINYNEWQTWQINNTSKLWFVGGAPSGSGLVNYSSTFNDILEKYPNAKIEGIIINQGSGNTGWHTRIDNVRYMDTVFDFELLTSTPTAKIEAVSKTNNSNITIKGIASDDKVGIVKHEFKITKPDGIVVNHNIDSTDKIVEFDLETILGEPLVDGDYNIDYVVTNALDTQSEQASHKVSLSRVGPDVLIDVTKNNNKKIIKIEVVTNYFNHALVTITKDGKPYKIAGITDKKQTLAKFDIIFSEHGEYNVTITAYDDFNNMSKKNQSVSVPKIEKPNIDEENTNNNLSDKTPATGQEVLYYVGALLVIALAGLGIRKFLN